MFLQVPLKKTRKYNLEANVLRCIANSLGEERASSPEIRAAAHALGQKRDAAALAILIDRPNHGGCTMATLNAALTYINCVNRVASMVPEGVVLPSGTSSHAEEFEWKDAFSDKTTQSTQYKLDLVACLVNCGSILSTLAIRQSYSANLSEEDLLSASSFFSRAAGFFDYCCGERMPYHVAGGTVDLHAPSQTACKYAMIANAQQLLYRSAQKNPQKYSLMDQAAIAAGARSLYEVVATNCKSPVLSQTAIGRYMAPAADVLSLYFGAEADLLGAEMCMAEAMKAVPGKFSEHMGRTRKACLALQAADRIAVHLPSGSDEAKEFPSAIRKRLQYAIIQLEAAQSKISMFQELEPPTSSIVDIMPRVEAVEVDISWLFNHDRVVDEAVEPLCRLKPLN